MSYKPRIHWRSGRPCKILVGAETSQQIDLILAMYMTTYDAIQRLKASNLWKQQGMSHFASLGMWNNDEAHFRM